MPSVSAPRRTRLPGAILAAVLATGLAACAQSAGVDDGHATAGDVDAGAALILKLGCGSCHTIPGIVDANGMVGPSLDHMASRQFIAGMLRNTPDDMVLWLRGPQTVVPGNAMPDLGISEHDARQITAYLATLK